MGLAVNDLKSTMRRLELAIFRRCYCAHREHGAGYKWGIPVPFKWAATLDAKVRSERAGSWTVAKFGARSGSGNIE